MKAHIKKNDIFPVLSQVQGLLEKRATLPIYMNILLQSEAKDRIKIYASDSELSFSADCKGQVEEEGAIVVNGKNLFDIVREFSEEVFEMKTYWDIDEDKEIPKKNEGVNKSEDVIQEREETKETEETYKIQVKQNQSVFKIHGLNPDDFPSFPSLVQEKGQKIKVGDMLEVIDKTLYCVSLDESRYHLTGVFVEQQANSEKYRFVATDGHRMSFIDIKGESHKELQKGGIIIPKKGLQEVKKMLHQAEHDECLEFSIHSPRLLIKFKAQTLSIRLIEGDYPPYKKLIPEYKKIKIVISRDDFLSSVKRISVLTSARFKGVNFTFKNNLLRMQFSHPDVGLATEELPCKYKGKEITVRFNSKYILDILQSIHEDRIEITLQDKSSQGLIQAKGKDHYICLVMPMKL